MSAGPREPRHDTARVPRGERIAFWAGLCGLWLLFLVQAWNTPVLLDDWYQLTYWRHHEFGPAAIWEYGHYNYFHFNPRIGDVFLAIVNGPRIVHLILTPLVELGVLLVVYAIAFARWPRPTWRDLQLLLFLQVMIWIVIPIPGLIYFYRPFATNYLWAFGLVLALFVPYRLALARGTSPRRLWALPLLFVLGWLAGMSNEHTGPTAMLAMAIFIGVAWKRRQLRAWMIAGGLGLYIGYPMLFFAPGQALRYAGMATRNTPTFLLKERGLDGSFEIVLEFVAEAQVGILFFLVMVLVYVRAIQRRGDALPEVPRTTVCTAAVLMLGAGSIVVTLFASPTASERLFLASALLLVAAFAVFVEWMFAEPALRRFVTIACTIIFAYHAVSFIWVYIEAKAQNDERIAIMQAAPDDTVAAVPPYERFRRSRWFWGDDFRYASLREYVANEVFDLANVHYDRYLRYAQPAPRQHYVATRTFDPPLPPEVAAKIAPVRYVPTYWEWTIVQLRRLLATTDLASYQGHRLVRYEVKAVNTGLDDPKQRPVYVVEWTPESGFEFVDGRPEDDALGRPFVRVWEDSVPDRYVESFAVDCGKTRKIEPVRDADELGPMLPIQLDCVGVHTVFMCEPDRCWLAGTYWR